LPASARVTSLKQADTFGFFIGWPDEENGDDLFTWPNLLLALMALEPMLKLARPALALLKLGFKPKGFLVDE
jgi:hypothetical protein